MKKIVISLFLICSSVSITTAQSTVKRVILFGIDGLHREAPDKLNMSVFSALIEQGTIFLSPDNKVIQEVISPEQQTAFVVNTPAYKSVGRVFSTSIINASLSDKEVVEQAVKILETDRIYCSVDRI